MVDHSVPIAQQEPTVIKSPTSLAAAKNKFVAFPNNLPGICSVTLPFSPTRRSSPSPPSTAFSSGSGSSSSFACRACLPLFFWIFFCCSVGFFLVGGGGGGSVEGASGGSGTPIRRWPRYRESSTWLAAASSSGLNLRLGRCTTSLRESWWEKIKEKVILLACYHMS